MRNVLTFLGLMACLVSVYGQQISTCDSYNGCIASEIMKWKTTQMNRSYHLVSVDSVDEAITVMEEIRERNQADPMIPLLLGMFHDIKQDRAKAEFYLRQSLYFYDYLLGIRPLLINALDRAMIIERLYGRETYLQTMDTLQATYPNDSVHLYRDVMSYGQYLEGLKKKASYFDFMGIKY